MKTSLSSFCQQRQVDLASISLLQIQLFFMTSISIHIMTNKLKIDVIELDRLGEFFFIIWAFYGLFCQYDRLSKVLIWILGLKLRAQFGLAYSVLFFFSRVATSSQQLLNPSSTYTKSTLTQMLSHPSLLATLTTHVKPWSSPLQQALTAHQTSIQNTLAHKQSK